MNIIKQRMCFDPLHLFAKTLRSACFATLAIISISATAQAEDYPELNLKFGHLDLF